MSRLLILFFTALVWAQDKTCEPWCSESCKELNGNIEIECGTCSKGSSRCYPGADGWTGYYDTTLHDGTDRAVLPDENVNAALGWDPALSGGNALWGSRGGQNVEDPAPWSNNEPLTVQEFSDSDYVPYGYTQGGPSHSSVGME